jgi:hypothetical protein
MVDDAMVIGVSIPIPGRGGASERRRLCARGDVSRAIYSGRSYRVLEVLGNLTVFSESMHLESLTRRSRHGNKTNSWRPSQDRRPIYYCHLYSVAHTAPRLVRPDRPEPPNLSRRTSREVERERQRDTHERIARDPPRREEDRRAASPIFSLSAPISGNCGRVD